VLDIGNMGLDNWVWSTFVHRKVTC